MAQPHTKGQIPHQFTHFADAMATLAFHLHFLPQHENYHLQHKKQFGNFSCGVCCRSAVGKESKVFFCCLQTTTEKPVTSVWHLPQKLLLWSVATAQKKSAKSSCDGHVPRVPQRRRVIIAVLHVPGKGQVTRIRMSHGRPRNNPPRSTSAESDGSKVYELVQKTFPKFSSECLVSLKLGLI